MRHAYYRPLELVQQNTALVAHTVGQCASLASVRHHVEHDAASSSPARSAAAAAARIPSRATGRSTAAVVRMPLAAVGTRVLVGTPATVVGAHIESAPVVGIEVRLCTVVEPLPLPPPPPLPPVLGGQSAVAARGSRRPASEPRASGGEPRLVRDTFDEVLQKRTSENDG